MDDAKPSTSTDAEFRDNFSWPVAIKSRITSVGGLAFAYKSYRQVMAPENKNLTRVQIMNGATLASKALSIASVLTVSVFGVGFVLISTILQVNTPKEFSSKMTSLFGDRFRISKKKNPGKSYNSLSELMEEISIREKEIQSPKDS